MAAVNAGVRTFRHPSRLQHRYYRANVWTRIMRDTAQRRVRELEEVAELMASMLCSL
jgi:hypothetical protein